MSILRYLIQGFGWEVGRTAARGTIDELKGRLDEAKRGDEAGQEPAPPSPREARKLEAARRREAARQRAAIEAELRRLKKAR